MGARKEYMSEPKIAHCRRMRLWGARGCVVLAHCRRMQLWRARQSGRWSYFE